MRISRWPILCLLLVAWNARITAAQHDDRILSNVVDPQKLPIELFWKDDQGNILKSIQKLKQYVESQNRKLIFAVNGGMYNRDNSPQGLFIQNGIIVAPLDTTSGTGNFYMKPNGVFYVTKDRNARVIATERFVYDSIIAFATQSGPMLIIDGVIHPNFKQGSANVKIRNGVGILPDGKVVFAMSKKEINFHDFASFFASLHCKNALYLDGFVSRTYLPAKSWIQVDGNFGVMIGILE